MWDLTSVQRIAVRPTIAQDRQASAGFREPVQVQADDVQPNPVGRVGRTWLALLAALIVVAAILAIHAPNHEVLKQRIDLSAPQTWDPNRSLSCQSRRRRASSSRSHSS